MKEKHLGKYWQQTSPEYIHEREEIQLRIACIFFLTVVPHINN